MAIDRIEIPKGKPRSDSGLVDQDYLALDMYLLINGVAFWRIYKMVFNSTKTDASIKSMSSAFLNSPSAQTYLEERRSQILKSFMGEEKEAKEQEEMPENFAEIIQKAAWNEFLQKGLHKDNKSAEMLLKKVLSTIESEEKIEPPIRVLSENCGNCRYKFFVEKNTFDECSICKYKEFGNKNGLNYNHTNQLNKKEDEF